MMFRHLGTVLATANTYNFSRLLSAGFLAVSIFSLTAGPIYDAAANGDLDKVRELVWADSTVVISLDTDGKTALHYAAAKGNLEMVKFLVANKATVECHEPHARRRCDFFEHLCAC